MKLLHSIHFINQNPTARYVTPFLVFLALTYIQSLAKDEKIFWLYGLKLLLTTLTFFYCFKGHWHEIEGKFDWKAVGLGLLVLAIWVSPELLFPKERTVTFNPNLFKTPFEKFVAVSMRLFGASVVVPVIEEIFWRSFLMRYFIRSNFNSIPLGTYTHLSFWLAAVTFALVHAPWQWGVGLCTGILYGAYLVKTKNLAGCILAHGTTNLGLSIFVILTGQWKFW